jgi:hypothetical protein
MTYKVRNFKQDGGWSIAQEKKQPSSSQEIQENRWRKIQKKQSLPGTPVEQQDQQEEKKPEKIGFGR